MKKPGWKQVPHEVRSFALSEWSEPGCASVRMRLCSVWTFRLTHWLALWRPFPVAYLHRRFLCRTATHQSRIAFTELYDCDSRLCSTNWKKFTHQFVIRSFWFVRRSD